MKLQRILSKDFQRLIGMIKVVAEQNIQILKNRVSIFKNLILFFIFFSCNEHSISCESIEYVEVDLPEFKTNNQINSFLENLYYNDQFLREELDKQSPGSPKYKSLLDSMHSMSLYNASIINKLGNNYNIQKNHNDFSDIALQTSWLIIHHSGDLDIRRCNFNSIYQDYCLGYITESQLYLYVRRTISLQNNMNDISDKINGMTLNDLIEYSEMPHDICD